MSLFMFRRRIPSDGVLDSRTSETPGLTSFEQGRSPEQARIVSEEVVAWYGGAKRGKAGRGKKEEGRRKRRKNWYIFLWQNDCFHKICCRWKVQKWKSLKYGKEKVLKYENGQPNNNLKLKVWNWNWKMKVFFPMESLQMKAFQVGS